ncbi:MAG: hypothetical protein WCP28_21125, partial [Actinomycetes bacterium]
GRNSGARRSELGCRSDRAAHCRGGRADGRVGVWRGRQHRHQSVSPCGVGLLDVDRRHRRARTAASESGLGVGAGCAVCRALGRTARRAGKAAWGTLRAANVEPNLRHLHLVGAQQLLSSVGQVNGCGVVVESWLGTARFFTVDTAGVLSQVAAELRSADLALAALIFDDASTPAGPAASDRQAAMHHLAVAYDLARGLVNDTAQRTDSSS